MGASLRVGRLDAREEQAGGCFQLQLPHLLAANDLQLVFVHQHSRFAMAAPLVSPAPPDLFYVRFFHFSFFARNVRFPVHSNLSIEPIEFLFKYY